MSEKLIDYVDMTFGTGDKSLLTIGPMRPHASVAPGPDTFPRSYSTGYLPNEKTRGFSQIHANCGEPKYGNFLISPQIGLATALDSHDSEKENENPTAAEYSVSLVRYGIDVSFSPTEHSVFYKIKYPSSDEASLVIDIANYFQLHSYNTPRDIKIGISEDSEGNTVIFGKGDYDVPTYSLHFYAVISKSPKVIGTYKGAELQKGCDLLEISEASEEMVANGFGAYLTFDTCADEEIYLKIGVSFLSIEKAREYLYTEIPDWNYDKVKRKTEDLWEKELGKIRIDDSTSSEKKRMHYTCLYNCHKMPRDRTGEFEKFGNSDMIDDHIATWDTYRTLYPLYTITNPDFVAKTVNSYATRLKVDGCVRDLFNGGNERMRNQGGDNVDNIIGDAYQKGIEGIDWKGVYELIKENAEYWRDDQNVWRPVRSADSTYRSLGYIPGDGNKNIMCCSKTIEYAYNDYLAAQIALGLGDTQNYKKWLKRSENWKNLWNDKLESDGFCGYIWPKAEDGEWIERNEFIPSASYKCRSWKPYFYEGTSYEYSFLIPHAIDELIEKMGGEKLFIERIRYGIEKKYINIDNQPGMLQAYLPNHTSEPWHTSDFVEMQLADFKEDGTPGNDDSGCFCSWYIFANIGFYPNAGQDFYYFTSPKYKSTVIELQNGKKLVIKAENFSKENKYIQTVTLNGKKLNNTTIKHKDIINGGELIFTMGSSKVNYSK